MVFAISHIILTLFGYSIYIHNFLNFLCVYQVLKSPLIFNIFLIIIVNFIIFLNKYKIKMFLIGDWD